MTCKFMGVTLTLHPAYCRLLDSLREILEGGAADCNEVMAALRVLQNLNDLEAAKLYAEVDRHVARAIREGRCRRVE